MAKGEGSWAGTTLAGRRDARRGQLLAVGLELLGAQGASAVSVRSVCREAGLTDRYFYESFANREELLLAVYDHVAAEAGAALVAAIPSVPGDRVAALRAVVEAFVAVLVDDPRKGRVLLLEPLAEPALSAHAGNTMPMFAALIRAEIDRELRAPQVAAQLTATALVGALSTLFIRWLDGSLTVSRTELVDYCVTLLLAAIPLAQGTPVGVVGKPARSR